LSLPLTTRFGADPLLDFELANKQYVDNSSGGGFWAEVARETLSVASTTIDLTSIPFHKYYRIIVSLVMETGSMNGNYRWNGDTGTSYSWVFSAQYGTTLTTVNATSIALDQASSSERLFGEMWVLNVADQEKLAVWRTQQEVATGSASAPDVIDLTSKWTNAIDPIDQITIVTGVAGKFDIGSSIIVLGAD